MTFEICTNENEWWFRIRAKNGRILAHSENYCTKRDCVKAVNLIIREAVWARIK